jgi:hypothetical protein
VPPGIDMQIGESQSRRQAEAQPRAEFARQAFSFLQIDDLTRAVFEASRPGMGIGELGSGLQINLLRSKALAGLKGGTQKVDFIRGVFIKGGSSVEGA